jgi:hypothetical protein
MNGVYLQMVVVVVVVVDEATFVFVKSATHALEVKYLTARPEVTP